MIYEFSINNSIRILGGKLHESNYRKDIRNINRVSKVLGLLRTHILLTLRVVDLSFRVVEWSSLFIQGPSMYNFPILGRKEPYSLT